MEDFWDGHRERLRLRAEIGGLDGLRPHEQLELLLFHAQPRTDMGLVSRALLDRFIDLKGVFHADRRALMAVPGMTKPVADWLLLNSELIAAYTSVDPDELPRIYCFRDMLRFLAGRWREAPPPQSWMVYTDFDHHQIAHSVICESLCWWDPNCVADMVNDALSLGARHAYLVLFMGIEVLELADWEMDSMLAVARTLRAINVELLDCVLVGEQGFVSLNLEGRMDDIRRECTVPALYERYREEVAP